MKIIRLKNKSQADPYVLQADGKYYLYCTGKRGVPVYVSDSLKSGWRYVGQCLAEKGQKDYWAPCVIAIDGKYYMYYSSRRSESRDVHEHCIKVAVSDAPTGPFRYVQNVLPPFSIDAHVVQNDTGLYIFYACNNYEGDKVGTYVAVDAMRDPYSVCGKPKAVVRPALEEEIFQKNRFKAGQDWYTIEGAFYFKEQGVHYCMYSANSYLKPTYHIGYVVSRDQSDRLNEIEFVRPFDTYHPLIASSDTEQSTGHNSVAEEDGQKYVVYHGRDSSSDLSREDRTARICKLFALDGVLTVERR